MKKSKIWTTDKIILQGMVNESETFSKVLSRLGLSSKGSGNHHRLKQRLNVDDIDYSHIRAGLGNNFGRKFRRDWIPLTNILVENSTYTSRQRLKLRLVKEGLLEYKCAVCGLNKWLGKPLSLQLDHRNGVFNDNRLLNLRLVCPNCHSQSSTYAGKNKKK